MSTHTDCIASDCRSHACHATILLFVLVATGCAQEFPTRPADEQDALRSLKEMGCSVFVRSSTGDFWVRVPGNWGQGGGWTDDDLRRAIPHFKKLHEPWCLDLQGTQITDRGVRLLKKLQGLKNLGMEMSQHITDASVEHLSTIKTLEWFDHLGTSMTPRGAHRLARALPRVRMRLGIEPEDDLPVEAPRPPLRPAETESR